MSQKLLDAILENSTGKHSRIHGPTHWAGVAAAALTLCENTPDADRRVVLLFAMLHDSMRESDGHDPEHGARAADLARNLRDAGDLELDAGQLTKLTEALVYHDKGRTSADPTIGRCWDADRLNLWRVGMAPKSALLSTAAARRLSGHAGRIFSTLAFDWPAIFDSYATENTVYLRFGDLPPDGCSNVPYLGFRECGASAYPGSRLEDGSDVLDFRRCLLGIDTRFLAWLLKQARPLYLVEGRPVGIGGMGEPVLEGARIVCEVPVRSVDALPDRPRFKALIKAWRMKREDKDPGPQAFAGATEPDELRVFPLAQGAGFGGIGETLRTTVETQKRGLLEQWGLLDEYDRQQREKRRQPKPQQTDYWKESFWT